MLKTFSIGGIHPSDKKISKDCRIEVLPVPSKVYISVAQHLVTDLNDRSCRGSKVLSHRDIYL